MIGRMLSATSLAIALGATLTAAAAPQANGSITGTVKVAGQTNNADVVVYVEHATGEFKPPAAPAVMDQKSLKFVPHVLPILVGTTVKFTNSDTVAHNVFSPDHEKYNLGTFGPGSSKDHAFAKCAKYPCVYTQLCNIHPEMEGFIVVVQNPYVATTDDAGRFTISNVPPGNYQVTVWQEKGKGQPRPVTVEAGKAATVDLTVGK